MIPLMLLLMVGLLLLLVSTATTKRMNKSLLDQVHLVRSEKQVALKSGDTCKRDLKMKTEEIRRKDEEIEKIKRSLLRENNEYEKKKTNLDESNKLLLQLLMTARQEKKTLLGKISSLEKEILKGKDQNMIEVEEDTVNDKRNSDLDDLVEEKKHIDLEAEDNEEQSTVRDDTIMSTNDYIEKEKLYQGKTEEERSEFEDYSTKDFYQSDEYDVSYPNEYDTTEYLKYIQ